MGLGGGGRRRGRLDNDRRHQLRSFHSRQTGQRRYAISVAPSLRRSHQAEEDTKPVREDMQPVLRRLPIAHTVKLKSVAEPSPIAAIKCKFITSPQANQFVPPSPSLDSKNTLGYTPERLEGKLNDKGFFAMNNMGTDFCQRTIG